MQPADISIDDRLEELAAILARNQSATGMGGASPWPST
jgi:hypothetical protein